MPLPMPTQPATLTAMRVATKATSTFFIGVPLSSRHTMHTSCLAIPLVARCRRCVHCLRRQWGTLEGDCVLGDTVRARQASSSYSATAQIQRLSDPETRGVVPGLGYLANKRPRRNAAYVRRAKVWQLGAAAEPISIFHGTCGRTCARLVNVDPVVAFWASSDNAPSIGARPSVPSSLRLGRRDTVLYP